MNQRPNTRVQRTRSSPSAPHSPLTRHPLGGERATRGRALAAALCLVVSGRAFCQAQPTATPTATPTPASSPTPAPSLQPLRITGDSRLVEGCKQRMQGSLALDVPPESFLMGLARSTRSNVAFVEGVGSIGQTVKVHMYRLYICPDALYEAIPAPSPTPTPVQK
jgi:hypothetical protein